MSAPSRRTVLITGVALISLLLLGSTWHVQRSSTGKPALSRLAQKRTLTSNRPLAQLPTIFVPSPSQSARSSLSTPLHLAETASKTFLIPSLFLSDPSNTLTYRDHLERTTSPASQIIHSSTLTFDAIYVLSLPTRTDRREQMTQLAKAHGLRLTFVDAANKNAPFIRWIAERAVETRKERLRIMVRCCSLLLILFLPSFPPVLPAFPPLFRFFARILPSSVPNPQARRN
jgi:hypothetical protein